MTDVPSWMRSVRSPTAASQLMRERRVPLLVAPGLEVVGDEDRVEPDLLGLRGIRDEVARAELLRGRLPTNLEHTDSFGPWGSGPASLRPGASAARHQWTTTLSPMRTSS